MSLLSRRLRHPQRTPLLARSGTPVRARASALLLAGLVVSQFVALGAPGVASAAAPQLNVGLYHGNSGSSFQGFNGTSSAYPNPQDLTHWGPGDWRLWGANGSTQAAGIEKSGVSTSPISNLAAVPPSSGSAAGLAAASGTRPFTFSWADGTAPALTGTGVLAGVQPASGGAGSGFSLTVPLPTATQRLRLWVSSMDGTGVMTATVPGLAPVTNSEMVGKSNDHGGIFEIDVQGSGSLTVTYVLTCPQQGGCTADSHVTMYAATYTGTAEPPSFSVDVTAGQQSQLTTVQGSTTPLVSSVTTRVITAPVSQVTLTPAVTTEAGADAKCSSSSVSNCLTATVSPSTVTTFPATSSVTITPSLDIAAGTYHVTVTGTEIGGARDVNTANFDVTVLPLTQVPFLYRAFPNDTGAGNTPGVTVVGIMHGDKNQTYRVQFSTATTCSSNHVAGGTVTAGPAIEIPTDAQGSAFIGHAIAIPASTTFVAAQVVAYVSATAQDGTKTWTSLGSTALGPCIVVSDPNESWPWAIPIKAGSDGTVQYAKDQYVDDYARSRWFKFQVQPGSRVHVTISGLQKDLDAYLFRDILQAYDAGASLLRQTAEYAPPSYAPPSYAPPSYAPDSLAPPSYAPPSYAPPSYAPPSYAPPSYAPPSYAPPSYAPPSYAPPSYAPPSYAPPSYATANWAPPSYAPPSYAPPSYAPPSYAPPSYAFETTTDYAAAQTRSLIGWNVDEGTLSATIDANTWTNTGNFYVRVNGKYGLYDIEHAFHISITTDPSVCTGVDPIGTYTPLASASGKTSLILWNSARISGTPDEKTALGDRLQALAARADVDGAVVDLATSATFKGRFVGPGGLYAQADAHRDCVYGTNLVASAARDVVNAYRDGNSHLKYVVLVGGDDSVPFFRYPDPAYLGPESDYVPPVKPDSTSEASLRSNYVLGQDEYGAATILNLGPSRIPVPDLAVGRLVETAAEAAHMVDVYTQPKTDVAEPVVDPMTLTPKSALEAGYDFLADTADAVSTQLVAGMPTSASNQKLITAYGSPQQACLPGAQPNPGGMLTCNWTADQLRAAVLGQRHDMIFLAGHFSANEALAADFTTRLNVSELTSSSVDLRNTLIFSNGCHSGYNIVNGHAILGVTEPLDWAQAFAQKGATLIAGTGYQYGDTDFLEYSERIYAEFAHQLRVGAGPVAVGDALVASKLQYMSTTQSLSGLHEKAILESALYGLPMFKVNMTGTRDTAAGSSPESLTFAPGDVAGGLTWTDLAATTATTAHSKSLSLIGGGTASASWYSGDDGVSLNPGDPVLPLDTRDVTASAKVLRGVVWLGGDYTDITPVVPLTATAGTELGGTHLTFGSPVFYPERPFSVNYFDQVATGQGTNLLLTPAQHRIETAGSTNALVRRYSGLDVRMYYLNTAVPTTDPVATALAPSMSGVGAIIGSNDQVTFQAKVAGDPFAGPLHAWITYTTGPDASGHGTWRSVSLTAPTDGSSIWTGTTTVPGVTLNKLRFLAQAVSKGGAVAIDTNFGRYYGAWVTPPASALSLTLSSPSAIYGSSVVATATLSPAVAGKPVIIRLGSTTVTAATNGSGIATATLPLQVTPGAYTASAGFPGDDTLGSSNAVQAFTINKINTTTTIAHDPLFPLRAGAESGVSAVVKDVNGDPLAFRNMFFVVDGVRANPATDPLFGYTVTRLTDATGTARLGPIPTPFAGGKAYTITAYYASSFKSVPDGSSVDTTDAIYVGSSSGLPVAGDPPLVIDKGNQTITFDTIPAKTFGDAPFLVTATASSGLPVTFTTSTPATCTLSGSTVTIVTAGDCILTASQAGDATWSAAADVVQRAATAKATATVALDCTTGGPFTYTGLAQAPCTATATNAASQPLAVGFAFTYNGLSASPVAAGDYAVVATVADPNYAGTASGSATIGKATLTVTPDNQAITYGATAPGASFYTASVTGFVNNETSANAAGYVAPVCTSTYTASTPVSGSPLDITCSGGSAANYTFNTAAKAALTIGKADQAAVTISGTSSPASYYEKQTLSASGGSSTGTVTFTSTTPSICTVSGATLTIVASSGTCSVYATIGADANYKAATSAPASVTAKKATLTVTPDNQAITYGATAPGASFYTASVTGFVNNETSANAAGYVAPVCTSAYTASTPVSGSPLDITCSGGSADNYTFNTTAKAALAIGKADQATLTITGPATKTYGDAAFAPATSGGSGTGAVTFTSSTTSVCTATGSATVTIVAVGTCTVTATKAADSNYKAATSAPFSIAIGKIQTAITALSVTQISPNPIPQFSDTVTLKATVSPAIDGTVSFQVNGNPAAGITGTVSGGVAQVTIKLDSTVIPSGAGTYTVSATFTPTLGTYAASSLSKDVPVQKEGQQTGGQPDGSSRIDYTGDQFVTVGVNPTLKAKLVQARPPELNEPAADLLDAAAMTQVKVVFTVYPAGCAAAAGSTPTTCPAAVYSSPQLPLLADGTVSAAIPATATLPEGAYVVVVSAVDNKFVLPMVGTSAFVVSSTGNTYISGGGFVTTDSTSNVDSPRGMFAFNSSKATGIVVGSNAYVYRMRINVTDGGTTATKPGTTCTAIGPTAYAGCRDVDVVIRSTTQTTLNAGQKGYLTGKVTIQYVDAADPAYRYTALETANPGGDFRLDIVDNSQAGTASAYGFTAYLTTLKVFHQAYAGGSKPISQTGIKVATNTVVVGGGYISSHP